MLNICGWPTESEWSCYLDEEWASKKFESKNGLLKYSIENANTKINDKSIVFIQSLLEFHIYFVSL